MFENVIGQKKVITQLRRDIMGNKMPSSLLFHGDKYTGKQTAALETARVLLCEKGSAEWKCDCPSCKLNRRLVHPGLVLTGPHNFSDEIEACGDVYVRQDKKASAFLFIRSLEKCIRRFDPHAFEASEAKERKIKDLISGLDEKITIFDPETGRPEQKELKTLVGNAVEKGKALAKEYPEENVPVSAIRNITSWVHTTGSSSRKVVIIENCDKMMDSSRNALLKILEEPPNGVYFICITTRKGQIIPTILSRLRQYHFPRRSGDEERKVLESIFTESTGEYPNLESYFLAWRNVKTDDLRAYASKFITCLDPEMSDYLPVIQEIIENVKGKDNAYYFLRFLTDALRETYRNTDGDSIDSMMEYGKWNMEIQQCLRGIHLYNQRAALKIEDLFYTMRRKQ